MQPGQTVTVFEAEDGFLLFGPEAALAVVDEGYGADARRIPPQHLARVAGHVGSGAGRLSAESGRWLKLTRESAAAVSRHKDTFAHAGVLRDGAGQIVQHLKFEHLRAGALLTPAAPAVLGSIATQYALESALDGITAYLETIDEKLDKLLKQRRVEALALMDAVTAEITEAHRIYDQTGGISSVTWSKVQALSFELKRIQSEAVGQLRELADEVSAATGDADKLARKLKSGGEDAQFWLGVLARAISLQDRYSIIELARVQDEHPLQLDGHQKRLAVARREREQEITASLEAVANSVARAAQLTNAAKVTNPLNAPRVVRRANALNADVDRFATHAALQVTATSADEPTRWIRAARDPAGDARSAVGAAGSEVVGKAKSVGHAIEERRDDRVLRRAKKIEEKRHRS